MMVITACFRSNTKDRSLINVLIMKVTRHYSDFGVQQNLMRIEPYQILEKEARVGAGAKRRTIMVKGAGINF